MLLLWDGIETNKSSEIVFTIDILCWKCGFLNWGREDARRDHAEI